VYAVEVLSIHTVMADEELRASSVRATVRHREYTAVVVLTLGACLTWDCVTWASCAITIRTTALNNEIWNDTVEAECIVEVALCEFNEVSNGDRGLLLV
jgi:hypothetical protein